MLTTARRFKRSAIKAARRVQWTEYKAYKATCRASNQTPMSFEDWKAPEKQTQQNA